MKIVKYINKKIDRLYCFVARLRLKNHNFTIISNDCWGGGVYEDLHLPYTTPTVAVGFYGTCYLEFLENFNEVLNGDLFFVTESKYPEINDRRIKNQNFYPIGLIGTIELHFEHNKTKEEALEKWNRRKARINFDNIFIKYSDRNNCTLDLMKRFDKLPFKNKVLFSSKKIKGIKSVVFLNHYKNQPFIGDIYSDRWAYRKDFDVVKWLNKGQK